MRRIFFLLFSSLVASADQYNPFPDPLLDDRFSYHVYTSDQALNITAEAAQKRPDVALLLRNGEQWFWRGAGKAGVTPSVAAPVAAVAAPLIVHKLSTRAIHVDWRPYKNLTIRPDVDYYFQTGETRTALTLTWSF